MTAVCVISALRHEARTFDPRADVDGAEVRREISGVGPERARASASRCAEGGADALLSWGVAGGLEPGLAAGALVLATEVTDSDGARYAVDEPWRARVERRLAQVGLTPHAASISGSAAVLRSPEEKAARFRATGAAAVDMESAAVASVARAAGLPFLALRSVCDDAYHALPSCVLDGVDGSGRARLATVLAALVRRPGELSGLLRLRGDFAAALDTLRRVRRGAGRELVSPRSAPTLEGERGR